MSNETLLILNLLASFFTLIGFQPDKLSHNEALSSVISNGSFSFTFPTFQLLKQPDKNIVFSPFSMASALAMINHGARGKTRDQLSQVLFGFSLSGDDSKIVAGEFKKLINSSLKTNKKVLRVDNLIYIDKENCLLDDFNATIQNHFNADSKIINFTEHCSNVNHSLKISDVSTTTIRIKIPKLFDELNPHTKLVLVSGVYFKSIWNIRFPKFDIRWRTFTRSNGQQIEVAMMRHYISCHNRDELHRFHYNQIYKVKTLVMEFHNSDIEMVFILPDEIDGLARISQQIDFDLLQTLLNETTYQGMLITIPRFAVESSFDLIPTLKKLGAVDMFETGADFSGIAKGQPFVDKVIQKAMIRVTETGTEAWKLQEVFGISMFGCDQPKFQKFQADHPFLFFLIQRNHGKNLILFVGAVEEPKFF